MIATKTEEKIVIEKQYNNLCVSIAAIYSLSTTMNDILIFSRNNLQSVFDSIMAKEKMKINKNLSYSSVSFLMSELVYKYYEHKNQTLEEFMKGHFGDSSKIQNYQSILLSQAKKNLKKLDGRKIIINNNCEYIFQ